MQQLAAEWAAQRLASGRASSARWPKEHFWLAATSFLRSLCRLRPAPPAEPGRYETELGDFIAAQQEGPWLSEGKCRSARWQITQFLDSMEQRGVALRDLVATDIDAFFEHMAQCWSRSSLHTSARKLRAWFRYCETRGWIRAGLADGLLLPRLYRKEGLPLGPTWAAVGEVLAGTRRDDPASLRDHAIILLLSVHGLRSGEVRRLRLDELDWARDRIRWVRSKSKREEAAPLEPRGGQRDCPLSGISCSREHEMVEISLFGSGEGLGWATAPMTRQREEARLRARPSPVQFGLSGPPVRF